jgi:uncharacterized OsmC-like protein
MSTITPNVVNGVDRDVLFGALNLLSEERQLTKFQFRATNEWVSGTHSVSTVNDFYGLGDEQTHSVERTFTSDHPEQFGASDAGITPVEHLLHALAGCITAGIGNISAARGIRLDRVTSKVTGDIDLAGLLGLDPAVRNGYSNIAVSLEIEGDGDAEQLRKVVERSVARSAVFDMLTNGTTVDVHVA